MMRSVIESEFLGHINGVPFKNEAVYDATAEIIETLEDSKLINIGDEQFTKKIKDELSDLELIGKQLDEVVQRTNRAMTEDKTLKDFKIMSGETSIDQDSTFNQMAKRGDFEYVVNQYKPLEPQHLEFADRYITIVVDPNWNGSLALHQVNKSGEVPFGGEAKPFVEKHDVEGYIPLQNKLEEIRNYTRGNISVGLDVKTANDKDMVDMGVNLSRAIKGNTDLYNIKLDETSRTWPEVNNKTDNERHIMMADSLAEIKSETSLYTHSKSIYPFSEAMKEHVKELKTNRGRKRGSELGR